MRVGSWTAENRLRPRLGGPGISLGDCQGRFRLLKQMTRPLRYIPPGQLVEVTNRTFQGRYLLLPTKALRPIVIGVLGRAQRLFSMAVHGFVFASNHYHLLVSPSDAKQLAEFMAFFQSKLAREINRLYGWSGALWSDRYHSIPIDSHEATQVARLRYVVGHGVKEGLVTRAAEWPGANCVLALTEGKAIRGTWCDRTAAYRASRWGRACQPRDFEETEEVSLSPLPCWRDLPWQEIRVRVKSLVESVEREAWARHRLNHTRPIGLRRILGQRPDQRPAALKSSPRPWFHARSREGWNRMYGAYRAFVDAFRLAAEAVARGEKQARFPEGSFPPGRPFVPHQVPG